MKHTILLSLFLLLTTTLSAQTVMPDSVRNYAKSIKDNGESLEKQDFEMGVAIVRGTLYGFDSNNYDAKSAPEVTVEISDPFRGNFQDYTAKVDKNGRYEVLVPMTMKHQFVWMVMTDNKFKRQAVISTGKTVVADFDLTENSDNLTPYYSGENVDINYALTDDFIERFGDNIFADNQDEASKFNCTQYKQFVLKAYADYLKRIESKDVTKRAKELLTLQLKNQCAIVLGGMSHYAGEIALDKDYLDYPKLLGIDDVMMFYARNFGYAIYRWNAYSDYVFCDFFYEDDDDLVSAKIWEQLPSITKLSSKEKKLAAVIAQKLKNGDSDRTDEEEAFEEKYSETVENHADKLYEECIAAADKYKTELFGEGGSYFKDFCELDALSIGYYLGKQTVVPDSVVAQIEQMRLPFYADYVKAKNAEFRLKNDAEKLRGGYYAHQAGESEGDSLLVELLKDYKGKVVFIDFCNTWCMPCRAAIKEMEPMRQSFEGKDVEFLYIADETSPQDDYDRMFATIKGHHYRLPLQSASLLMKKFGFTGIPAYVLIGKDGMIKDFHLGFYCHDYDKELIEEELQK